MTRQSSPSTSKQEVPGVAEAPAAASPYRISAYTTDRHGRARFQPHGDIFSVCDLRSDGMWTVADLKFYTWPYSGRYVHYRPYDENGAAPGCKVLDLSLPETWQVWFRVCQTKKPESTEPSTRHSCSDWVETEA